MRRRWRGSERKRQPASQGAKHTLNLLPPPQSTPPFPFLPYSPRHTANSPPFTPLTPTPQHTQYYCQPPLPPPPSHATLPLLTPFTLPTDPHHLSTTFQSFPPHPNTSPIPTSLPIPLFCLHQSSFPSQGHPSTFPLYHHL